MGKAIETTTEQVDETTLVSVETTTAKKAIETKTAEQLDETTFVSVEAKTAEKAIETTASVEMEETSYAPVQSSTAWKDLASTAIVENEETTVVPVKTTTAKKEFETTPTIEPTQNTESMDLELGHSADAASTDSVLVQDKTILPIQLTPSTIENENMILTENEIFLPFFNEEGSGREENNEEIVEEEINKKREPRIMDDSVLKFLTYRTET